MEKEFEKLATSKQTAAKTLFAALNIIKDAGGHLPGREVVNKIRETVPLTDWEKQFLPNSGNIRWESVMYFYSIDYTKAGFIRKNKGIWYITEDGEKAIKLGQVGLLFAAIKAYREWKKANKMALNEIEEDVIEEKNEIPAATIEQLIEQGNSGIKEYINTKTPYEFQDMVAALLRAMKYYTPFISPKGKDGGLDIVAFRDPLGAAEPRIKVQVKHKPQSSIPVDDIRSLVGLLNKTGDIGLFVTSGRFSADAERFARDSHIHVRLIDVDNFISLWQDFYSQLSDEEKNMLPLHSIYFLGSNE